VIDFLFKIVDFVDVVGVGYAIIVVGIISLQIVCTLDGFISKMCDYIRYIFNIIQHYFLQGTVIWICYHTWTFRIWGLDGIHYLYFTFRFYGRLSYVFWVVCQIMNYLASLFGLFFNRLFLHLGVAAG
jgi:hypothetical protein